MTEQIKPGQIWQHNEDTSRQRVIVGPFDPADEDGWWAVFDPEEGHTYAFCLEGHYIRQYYSLVGEVVSEPEPETYTVEQIEEAFAKHATEDDWGIKSFYEDSLISALRGEYNKEDI